MTVWFWSFLLFSFLGYLLEKGYAASLMQRSRTESVLSCCPFVRCMALR